MGEFDDRIARLLEPGTGGRPLTDAMVAEAQARLGVELPADLLALLRVQNGGSVRDEFAACPAPRATSYLRDGCAPVETIMGIGPRPHDLTSLLDSAHLNETWGQPRELVLLTGDGHWWIALDYRAAGRWWRRRVPPVIFYDNDTEPHEEVVLAPSFRAFVERLEPAPEYELEPRDVNARGALASLTQLLEGSYRSHFRRALSSDAVLGEVRAELPDFGHRLDPRFATPVDPAGVRQALMDHAPPKWVVLFHAEREPFGAVISLDDALEGLLAGGGGIVSCFPGRLALYVDASVTEAVLLRRA